MSGKSKYYYDYTRNMSFEQAQKFEKERKKNGKKGCKYIFKKLFKSFKKS